MELTGLVVSPYFFFMVGSVEVWSIYIGVYGAVGLYCFGVAHYGFGRGGRRKQGRCIDEKVS